MIGTNLSDLVVVDLVPEAGQPASADVRQPLLDLLHNDAAQPAVTRRADLLVRTGHLVPAVYDLAAGKARSLHVGVGSAAGTNAAAWGAAQQFAASFLYKLLGDFGRGPATHLAVPPLTAGTLAQWVRRSALLTQTALLAALARVWRGLSRQSLTAFAGKTIVICAPAGDYDDYATHLGKLPTLLTAAQSTSGPAAATGRPSSALGRRAGARATSNGPGGPADRASRP